MNTSSLVDALIKEGLLNDENDNDQQNLSKDKKKNCSFHSRGISKKKVKKKNQKAARKQSRR